MNYFCSILPQIQFLKLTFSSTKTGYYALSYIQLLGNSPPLILILGYSVGVQVWLIPANGEAQEILAQKHGQIKTLKLLRTPDLNSAYGSPDNFAHCRPLMVTVDSAGPGPPFSSATFSSMKVRGKYEYKYWW